MYKMSDFLRVMSILYVIEAVIMGLYCLFLGARALGDQQAYIYLVQQYRVPYAVLARSAMYFIMNLVPVVLNYCWQKSGNMKLLQASKIIAIIAGALTIIYYVSMLLFRTILIEEWADTGLITTTLFVIAICVQMRDIKKNGIENYSKEAVEEKKKRYKNSFNNKSYEYKDGKYVAVDKSDNSKESEVAETKRL